MLFLRGLVVQGDADDVIRRALIASKPFTPGLTASRKTGTKRYRLAAPMTEIFLAVRSPPIDALSRGGELRPDPEQAAPHARLDTLATALEHPTPKRGSTLWKLARTQAPTAAAWRVSVGRCRARQIDADGPVLRTSSSIARKRRVHFAEFMIEVHGRIAIERRKKETRRSDRSCRRRAGGRSAAASRSTR